MLPVEILPVPGGALVLRARGSELLILSHHVSSLKKKTVPKDFTSYFINEALLNRPARKLFEAWLRKDDTLWRRMYHSIQNEVEVSEGGDEEVAKPAKKAEAKAPAKEKVEAPKKAAAKDEKPAKSAAPQKIEKKAEVKAKDTKKETKAAAPAKKVEAKAADKKKAAPAAKAKPAAKKPAAKKK